MDSPTSPSTRNPQDDAEDGTPPPSHTAMVTLAWISAAVIVFGFFRPWVSLDVGRSKAPKKPANAAKLKPASKTDQELEEAFRIVKKGWRKAEKTLPGVGIAGFQIPRLANSQGTQRAMDLAKLFSKQADERIGLKSYAVYLLPGIALALVALLSTWGRHRVVALLVAAVAIALPGVGSWKLLTTPVTGVRFLCGLWLSLLTYLGVAMAACGCAFPGAASKCLKLTSPSGRSPL